MVTQLADNLLLVNEGGRFPVAVQTYSRDSSFSGHKYGITPVLAGAGGFDHVRWGVGDNQPNTIRQIAIKNPSVRSSLETLRDMIYGSGVGFFQKIIEEGTTRLVPYIDTRLDEWSEATELQDYAIASINQRIDNANIFTRWQYSPMDDWFHLSNSDSFFTRIGNPDDREKKFHVNPYFGSFSYLGATNETEKIPAFNHLDRELNVRNTVTISHSKESIPGQPFYAFPSWWCAQESIELVNLITSFHKNGILNGYNIKYLIRMPQDYFDKDGNRAVDSKEVKERWGKWGDNLSKWLSGQKNVNKTMLVKYMRGSDGKALDNVDVVPLKNEMSDDAYDKVWNNSNQAITNSIGLLPTLAGVKAGSGNDSGSQIRVMADYQQHFRTPVHRYIVLKDINRALRFMGYRDVVAGFKEVQITTLDTNPTGAQAVVNQGQ